jgi:dUTP pyrophosphatase
MIVKFKKLNENAVIPTRGRDSDAGLDLYATDDLVVIKSNESVSLKTGIAWEVEDVPEGFNVYMQIKGRSGMAFKYDIEPTGAGVIDQEYRGEIGIKLYNMGEESYAIRRGDRIAQGIVKLIPKFTIVEAEELSETSRNTGGFGSSGK